MKEENNTMDWKENLRKNFHVIQKVEKFTLMHQYVTPIKVLKSSEEELIDFIEEQIHLTEESLVMRVRDEIEEYSNNPYQGEVLSGHNIAIKKILSFPLLTPKPKSDK